MTRAIASHEVLHALAGLVVVELRYPSRWPDVRVTLEINPSSGSCLIEVGDVIDDAEDRHISQQTAAIAALGPCAEAEDAIKLIHAEDWQALGEAGGLSIADAELLSRAQMPDLPLLATRTIDAVRALKRGLGAARWQRLCRAARDMSNDKLGSLTAEELAPRHRIQAAIRQAGEELAPLLGAASPGRVQVDRIVARTEAQAEAQAINEARAQRQAKTEAARQSRLTRKESPK
ncbi:hypothetical protein CEW88_11620 [Alloyangia pacifica]|uniref:Uncharacterized protein n=1 Tax=Alloyangia pacifica TaxID=311180 RepID=A0A2U8HGW0_9RHOB|nr:hypothetical protein [Alloyangia pacifica]AWI84276.1 hypothetical protein CEW88_11620 [Alloyangia pacifica]